MANLVLVKRSWRVHIKRKYRLGDDSPRLEAGATRVAPGRVAPGRGAPRPWQARVLAPGWSTPRCGPGLGPEDQATVWAGRETRGETRGRRGSGRGAPATA